jgi:hypothetical protein
MEWQTSKFLGENYETDAYDGYYKFVGFLDGYCGDPDYDLEYETIPFAYEFKLYDAYQSSSAKYEDYNSQESPSEKVAQRINDNLEKLRKYNGIISSLTLFKEEE